MPVRPLDAAVWNDLAAHADQLDALTTRLRAIQAQSAALHEAERAAIADLRATATALHQTGNTALAASGAETPEEEKRALRIAHQALAQAVKDFLPKLEHYASEEAVFADPARVNFDTLAQYVQAARQAIVERL